MFGRASALIATICITTKSRGQANCKKDFDAGVGLYLCFIL